MICSAVLCSLVCAVILRAATGLAMWQALCVTVIPYVVVATVLTHMMGGVKVVRAYSQHEGTCYLHAASHVIRSAIARIRDMPVPSHKAVLEHIVSNTWSIYTPLKWVGVSKAEQWHRDRYKKGGWLAPCVRAYPYLTWQTVNVDKAHTLIRSTHRPIHLTLWTKRWDLLLGGDKDTVERGHAVIVTDIRPVRVLWLPLAISRLRITHLRYVLRLQVDSDYELTVENSWGLHNGKDGKHTVLLSALKQHASSYKFTDVGFVEERLPAHVHRAGCKALSREEVKARYEASHSSHDEYSTLQSRIVASLPCGTAMFVHVVAMAAAVFVAMRYMRYQGDTAVATAALSMGQSSLP